jgi:hypothetical protein
MYGSRSTREAHARLLEGRLLEGGQPRGVRDMVADSWLRSVAAGINVDASEPPITLDGPQLGDYRSEHPLSRIFPLLYDVLGKAAEECDSVMAVADEHGQLLWVCGPPDVLRRAEAISFVEGAQWDEEHAGTNAPGTALRLDAPVTIKAVEHFVRPVQRWSCAAAPIHDPLSRRILGIVDITGGEDIGSPQTIAMIRAAARMAESELARLSSGPLWRPPLAAGIWDPVALPAAGGLHLQALGRPDLVVTLERRSFRLSPRHSEILVVLAGHEEGLSGDELAVLLYPGDVTSSTLRAEMVRMRALLGDALASRPYRLMCEVSSDWAAVAARLAAGDVPGALRLYHGPLLPQSEAPAVARQRQDLHEWMRAAILSDGRQELLVNWTQSRWGADDLEMWRRQCAILPATSPLRPRAEATASRLDAEFGR